MTDKNRKEINVYRFPFVHFTCTKVVFMTRTLMSSELKGLTYNKFNCWLFLSNNFRISRRLRDSDVIEFTKKEKHCLRRYDIFYKTCQIYRQWKKKHEQFCLCNSFEPLLCRCLFIFFIFFYFRQFTYTT